MEENGYWTFDKIPKDKRSNLTEKATKGYKLILAFISLSFRLMISNTVFICYLIMIVAHIMNGSLVSLVYPVSIFIYSLLEERRPKKNYWRIILLYSAVILVLKFLLQTYPISDWLTNGESADNQGSTKTSFNDFLRSIRLGLEVVVQGKNFVNYFLFEALILLSVTFHMFIQIFAGVWEEREIDKESIQEAAARISNIQRKKMLEKIGKSQQEIMNEDIKRKQQISNELNVDPSNDILLLDHEYRSRKRAYSVNDLSDIKEIRKNSRRSKEDQLFGSFDEEDER
jgi:hypothetical protein